MTRCAQAQHFFIYDKMWTGATFFIFMTKCAANFIIFFAWIFATPVTFLLFLTVILLDSLGFWFSFCLFSFYPMDSLISFFLV